MFWTIIPAGYVSTWNHSWSKAAIGIGSSSLPSPTHSPTPAGWLPLNSSIGNIAQASKRFTKALVSLPLSVTGRNQLVPGLFMLNW